MAGAKVIEGRGMWLMLRVDVRNLLNSWMVGRVIEGSGRDYQILFHGWNHLPSCTTNSKQGLDIAPKMPLAMSRNTARLTPVLSLDSAVVFLFVLSFMARQGPDFEL